MRRLNKYRINQQNKSLNRKLNLTHTEFSLRNTFTNRIILYHHLICCKKDTIQNKNQSL